MVTQNLSMRLAWLSVISIPGENLIFHSDDSQIYHIFLALIGDSLHLQLEIYGWIFLRIQNNIFFPDCVAHFVNDDEYLWYYVMVQTYCLACLPQVSCQNASWLYQKSAVRLAGRGHVTGGMSVLWQEGEHSLAMLAWPKSRVEDAVELCFSFLVC